MPKLATKPSELQTIPLREGRHLEISESATHDDVIEVRSASGQLEVRIELTENGPILQLDALKLRLRAEDTVAIDCKRFEVNASEELALKSEGSLETTSTGDTRIAGEKIFLN